MTNRPVASVVVVAITARSGVSTRTRAPTRAPPVRSFAEPAMSPSASRASGTAAARIQNRQPMEKWLVRRLMGGNLRPRRGPDAGLAEVYEPVAGCYLGA